MISLPPKGDTNKRVNANFIPLQVAAQVAPNMTVQIQPGSFWTADGAHVEYIGGNSPVLTAPGSAAKWVVISLNETGMIVVLDGTSSANPTLPAIPEAHLPLSGIFIGDTTTQITSDMVFDIRPMWATRAEVIPDLTGELANRPTIAQMDAAVAVKSDTGGTDSPTFTLNQTQLGTSSTDASIVVERGAEANVSIMWNETAEVWQFSNDGTNWGPLGMDPALYYTQTVLDAGELDTRYYTETESDTMFATSMHTHVAADVTDFTTAAATAAPVQSVAGRTGVIVLTTGDITDFNGAAYATAVQGVTADTAVQPADGLSTIVNDTGFIAGIDGESISDLGDVFTTMTPAADEVLKYDGALWQSAALVKANISDFVEGDYEPAFAKASAFNLAFGAAVTTVCEGNDVRLSDTRDPNAHTHLEADITDLDKYTVAAADALLLAKADVATPVFTGTVGLPTYTVVGVPGTVLAGHAIFVSDARGGLGSMCFGNTAATEWIDVVTGVVVAV